MWLREKRNNSAIALLLSGMLLLGSQALQAQQQIPVETFAKLPAISQVSLSPDGSKAVVLKALFDTYHAVVLDLKTGKSKLVMAADPQNFLFNWCRFANDTRVVCSIRSYVQLRARQVSAGARWFRDGRTTMTKLLAVDIDGGNVLQLIPEAITNVREDIEWNAVAQDQVVSWMKDDSKHILMQIAREDRVRPSVYRVNIYNNRMKRMRRVSPSVLRWYADDQGELRFAVGRLKSSGEGVAFNIKNNRLEQVDASHLGMAIREPTPLAVAADGQSLWVRANNGANTLGIHRIKLADATVVETLLSHRQYDMDGLLLHPQTKAPLLAEYYADAYVVEWFDKQLGQRIEAVRDAIPGAPSQIRIVSVDNTLSTIALYTQGNGTDPAYYVYGMKDRTLLKLAQWHQGPPVEFEAIRYPARDGMAVPAYIALPGPKDQGPYPLVIRPHGGPFARTTGNQYFITQYLVNNGYAVLKPNFRGSSGYGDAFMAAGFEQWGMKMQDDLIDGLDWMIAQGYADPQRVCIAGGSYGGYAALVAAFKTAERFKCAVSFAGVTDLDELALRWRNFRFGAIAAAKIQSGQLRKANSPFDQVEKIGVPLLIVHGDVDRSVMIEQSRSFVAALREVGKPVEYIEQVNGDHFFSLQSHRTEYLQALDSFLKKHL